ncbi:MAG: ABC transporter substrate-binding protein, partial [Chloroflexota bacterium]
MMNKRRRLLLGLALLLLPLIFSTVSAQDSIKRLVTNQATGDPRSIDPQQAIDTKDWNLENILFPAMTTFDEESRTVVGGLAESWDVSSDGLVYTFHLVKNVPWVHYNEATSAVEQVMDDSGKPRYVTAQDVIYGLTRALDPAVGSPASYILVPLVTGAAEFNAGTGSADALGLKAIDDNTLEITTPEAVGYALGIFGIIDARPTPKWAIDASGDAWTEPENINTYGPFALKEWVHDDHLTYVKNPFWPGSPGIAQPKLDELVVRFLDDSVALREYEAGNLDTLQPVASDQYDRVSTDPTLSKELKVVPGQCTTVWSFHTQRPPFDNVHIRRAFSYAVDRQSLVDNVMKGGRIPSRWYTPPSIAFAPSPEDNPDLGISFDADKAKAELQLGLTDLGLSSAADLPPITVIFGNSEGNNAVGQA